MARSASLIPLPDVLTRILKNHGMQTRMVECSLQQHWSEIVGDHVGHHTWPDSIRYQKLYLVVENSVWMQQLLFLKPELLATINASSDGETLTDIVMRVGPVAGGADSRGQTETPIQEPARDTLTGELHHAIATSVQPVSDPDLRERLRALFEKSAGSAPFVR